MEYKLRVLFVEYSTDTLYSGPSYLKKNLSDQILISNQEICITFDRNKSDVNVLDTKNSLVRYELQKALCFYIATRGTLPDVSSVEFYDGKVWITIQHEHFSDTWKNCHLLLLFSPETMKIIFSNHPHAKDIYIALTYFIKAQLDAFPNDCYRAAWTGMNAVYGIFNQSQKESEQLKVFANIIRNYSMDSLSSEIKSMGVDALLNSLNWYQFMHTERGNKTKRYLDFNYIKDTRLLTCLINHYHAFRFDITEQEHNLRNVLQKEREDISSILVFLICDYCYALRCRYFHAKKSYPVFIISKQSEMDVEEGLTKYLLLGIIDIITEYSEKERSIMEATFGTSVNS